RAPSRTPAAAGVLSVAAPIAVRARPATCQSRFALNAIAVCRPFLLVVTLCGLRAGAAAQTNVEGYAATLRPLPANASYPAVLPTAGAWFTGTDLQLLENGQPLRTLLSYGSFTFGAFTLALDSATLLFADSGPGQVWLVPTAPGATPTLLATIVLP